jgi:probable addiction module antidote protein
MPSRRVKHGTPVTDHDPKAALGDRKFIIESLTEALMDGDAQAFKEILAAHLEVVQKESFYERAGLSRRTLYRMLAPGGNPTLENIARVVRAIARPAA